MGAAGFGASRLLCYGEAGGNYAPRWNPSGLARVVLRNAFREYPSVRVALREGAGGKYAPSFFPTRSLLQDKKSPNRRFLEVLYTKRNKLLG
jgi:hypothetical protein